MRVRREPEHLRRHPFGLIPTYEEGDLALFETGAIIFHIAERHAGLFPEDADARARAITWMFAALTTVEPPILELVTARSLDGDRPWAQERRPRRGAPGLRARLRRSAGGRHPLIVRRPCARRRGG
jgi:glutathione S-transferase